MEEVALDQPEGRVARRQRRNRAALIRAAQVVMTEKGVDGATMLEIAERVRSDQAEGWAISYDRRTAKAASWSGSRGDRIFYARAMKGCDDAAIYFRLEYDRADLDAFDSVVGRLVKSLHPTC